MDSIVLGVKCEAAELQHKTSRETGRTHGTGFEENHSEVWANQFERSYRVDGDITT